MKTASKRPVDLERTHGYPLSRPRSAITPPSIRSQRARHAVALPLSAHSRRFLAVSGASACCAGASASRLRAHPVSVLSLSFLTSASASPPFSLIARAPARSQRGRGTVYRVELEKRDEGFGCFLSSRGGRFFAHAVSGPAEDAGARAGDELLGVGREYFRKGTTLDEVVAMVAAPERVTLLLRRGPSPTGAPPPPGLPPPAGEAEEVRTEAARAKWARAEAARVQLLPHAAMREAKQQEAAAEAAERQQREAALHAAARAAEAKEEERRRAERMALDGARARAANI